MAPYVPFVDLLQQTEVSQSTTDHFLAFEASQGSESFPSSVGPYKNPAGNENGNGSRTTSADNGNENAIATGDVRKKSDRRADNGLPDVNEIINGLLNVVGEGLTIATNYVKEEHKRKKDALANQVMLS
jgi:hypothetical protein